MDDESAIGCMAALSHTLRMKIFRFLMSKGPNGAHAGEISEAVDVGATTASFHFKELHRAGLIIATREGRFIRYSIRMETVRGLFSYLLTSGEDRPKKSVPLIEQLAKQLERFGT
jgi:ArsR family transcriptional regulator, arsenate/arsenite/antimonite-responsive transcriptional repressor